MDGGESKCINSSGPRRSVTMGGHTQRFPAPDFLPPIRLLRNDERAIRWPGGLSLPQRVYSQGEPQTPA